MASVVVTQVCERTTCARLLANAILLLRSPIKSGYDGSNSTLMLRIQHVAFGRKSSADSLDELHLSRQLGPWFKLQSRGERVEYVIRRD